MNNLKHILKNKKHLVFMDFEGTQFSHEIIASGIVKAEIDEEGLIVSHDEGLLAYSKSRCPIGKLVTNMTSITEDFIKANGKPFGETITEISNYLGDIDLNETLFVCFGFNDPKMIIESCRYSHPDNKDTALEWTKHVFDFLSVLSQYIKDDKGNSYSLVNYLKLFNKEPVGISHNPLNDALDLMNLYQAFMTDKEVVFEQYLKVLEKNKYISEPVKKAILTLIHGEDVSADTFMSDVREYLK